jgi:hypothetical protein
VILTIILVSVVGSSSATSDVTVAEEQMTMQATEIKMEKSLMDWDEASLPALMLDPKTAKSVMGPTIARGGLWPSRDQAREAIVPDVLVAPLREQADLWIRRVLRKPFVPDDIANRLTAVRGALEGEDAFLAAWTVEQRPFRVAVTREWIHVLTSAISPVSARTNLGMQATSALERTVSLANEILTLPHRITPEEIRSRLYGALLVGTVPVSHLQVDWHETLLLVTDGQTVKLSARRLHNRTSPPKGGSVGGTPQPWFPVP